MHTIYIVGRHQIILPHIRHAFCRALAGIHALQKVSDFSPPGGDIVAIHHHRYQNQGFQSIQSFLIYGGDRPQIVNTIKFTYKKPVIIDIACLPGAEGQLHQLRQRSGIQIHFGGKKAYHQKGKEHQIELFHRGSLFLYHIILLG